MAFAPLPSRRLPPPGQQPAASELACVAAAPASPLLACRCVYALHPHSSSASARRPLALSQSRVAASSSSPPIACTELCHDLFCTMRSMYTCPPCGIPPAHLFRLNEQEVPSAFCQHHCVCLRLPAPDERGNRLPLDSHIGSVYASAVYAVDRFSSLKLYRDRSHLGTCSTVYCCSDLRFACVVSCCLSPRLSCLCAVSVHSSHPVVAMI